MPTSLQLDQPSLQIPSDAQSDPEPAAPSLPEPDPGVFHHDPVPNPTPEPEPAS
ncbi:MAG: hypothetical protein V4555_20620 [Acidobacteriota bacterium]